MEDKRVRVRHALFIVSRSSILYSIVNLNYLIGES